jgi:hypothetical protein
MKNREYRIFKAHLFNLLSFSFWLSGMCNMTYDLVFAHDLHLICYVTLSNTELSIDDNSCNVWATSDWNIIVFVKPCCLGRSHWSVGVIWWIFSQVWMWDLSFFTAVKMSVLVFRVVMSCELVGRHQHFWGMYCFVLQPWRGTHRWTYSSEMWAYTCKFTQCYNPVD